MRTFCSSRRLSSLYFACAAVFLAIGVKQAPFTGVGMAFLMLALSLRNTGCAR